MSAKARLVRGLVAATTVGILATSVTGCTRRKSDAGRAVPSASAPASLPAPRGSGDSGPRALAPGVPLYEEDVRKAVNPRNEPPYAGATGTVAGTVTIHGDEAPVDEEALAAIPSECGLARDVYGKLFREGMMRTLADALVTVTGYDGYVPARELVVPVEAKECTWGTRTLGVTFGQRIEVVSKDRRTYLPKLVGSTQTAVMAAIPGGDPVKVYPDKPAALFQLTDVGRPFTKADVFVLKFATFDVTDPDGRFEIAGVPAGKARVDALLPVARLTTGRSVTVEAGRTVQVDLELEFDASRRVKSPKPPPVPAVR